MALLDQTTTYTGSPWEPLQEDVLVGVDEMKKNFAAGPYAGPYTAPINETQTEGFNAVVGQTGNLMEQGAELQPGLGSAFEFYQGNIDGSQNPWLTNPDDYFALAGGAADNPYLDGQITAALRDPFRDFTENQLPGNAMGAAMYGQSGGSGRQVGDAILQRGYMDRASDVGAAMRGNAWDTGLGIADTAARNDQLFANTSANNLAGLGTEGMNMQAEGAGGLFNMGTTWQGLENDQISADMEEFYEPWKLTENYGNYINPLATDLQMNTTNADMMPIYMAQIASGLGELGGDIGTDIWGWAKEKWGWGAEEEQVNPEIPDEGGMTV